MQETDRRPSTFARAEKGTVTGLFGSPPVGEISLTGGEALSGLDDTDVYALRLVGDSLEPVACSGEHAIVSPTQECEPGDFVVLVHEDPEFPPIIKRLVIPAPLPPGLTYQNGSTAIPAIVVETLTPRSMLQVRSDQLRAVHRVIGFLKRDGRMIEPPKTERVRRPH